MPVVLLVKSCRSALPLTHGQPSTCVNVRCAMLRDGRRLGCDRGHPCTGCKNDLTKTLRTSRLRGISNTARSGCNRLTKGQLAVPVRDRDGCDCCASARDEYLKSLDVRDRLRSAFSRRWRPGPLRPAPRVIDGSIRVGHWEATRGRPIASGSTCVA